LGSIFERRGREVIEVNRKASILVSVAFAMMLFAMPFMVRPAAAQVTYQQVTGKLGGADYLIRIPSNWQGDLVVMCRGYSPTPTDITTLEFYADAFGFITESGFALATSTYGEGGFCVQKGIIRTHQLTEYVIDNYNVPGKVFLFGMSMGGDIVLQLGAKYPDLYDGVFELAGVKNVAALYTAGLNDLSLTNDNDLATAILANGGSVPPCPQLFGYDVTTALAAYRAFCLAATTDIKLECGGTPETKPKAYERVSPIFSAVDIKIPTISVHGQSDSIVPYAQSLAYLAAVAQAGRSDLYRLYGVPGGEHVDVSPAMGLMIYLGFMRLVAWVEYGIPAPASTP
jgi:dienelactone hydrolase